MILKIKFIGTCLFRIHNSHIKKLLLLLSKDDKDKNDICRICGKERKHLGETYWTRHSTACAKKNQEKDIERRTKAKKITE